MMNLNCPSYCSPKHCEDACANIPYGLPMNILKDHDPTRTMGNLGSFLAAAVAGVDDSESLP